jgi:hypothetical protein
MCTIERAFLVKREALESARNMKSQTPERNTLHALAQRN